MNSSGSLLVTEALIIDEPWVTKIFRGEKTWELRSRHTYKRGWIALIRKGSGKVIGVANLTESRGPVPIGEMKAARALHQSATVSNTSRYRYAWVLTDARPLDVLVAYRHPAGAVIWV
jgi:ASCH domain